MLAVLGIVVGVASCAREAPKLSSVVATPMPYGESWEGVYSNAELGEMHLVAGKEPDAIEGLWKRSDDSRWGKVVGRADGTVLNLGWSERWLDSIGPQGHRDGKGYLVYVRVVAELDYALRGEYAAEGDDVARRWSWTKRSRTPDLAAMKRAIRMAYISWPDANDGWASGRGGDGRIIELNPAAVSTPFVAPPTDPFVGHGK